MRRRRTLLHTLVSATSATLAAVSGPGTGGVTQINARPAAERAATTDERSLAPLPPTPPPIPTPTSAGCGRCRRPVGASAGALTAVEGGVWAGVGGALAVCGGSVALSQGCCCAEDDSARHQWLADASRKYGAV